MSITKSLLHVSRSAETVNNTFDTQDEFENLSLNQIVDNKCNERLYSGILVLGVLTNFAALAWYASAYFKLCMNVLTNILTESGQS